MGAGQDHRRRPRAAARARLQHLSPHPGSSAGPARTRAVEVDPERIGRWALGFAERHGGLLACTAPPVDGERDLGGGAPDLGGGAPDLVGGAPDLVGSAPDLEGAGMLWLRAGDGAVAVLEPLHPDESAAFPRADHASDHLGDALVAWALPPEPLGLVLVRRGGYAVGAARGPRLVAHKTGSTYVQSRTAAGGWSQQRFARRRANQADALVGTVTAQAARVVLPAHPAALVVGGDKRLVADILADRRLAPLAGLPRRGLFDLPDPRLAVLESAVRRGRAVRVRLTDP